MNWEAPSVLRRGSSPSKLDSLAYSYFQVNRPPGKGTAMLCPYDRCGSNT
ncbi:MAG: hypothetical protein ACYTXL_33505 [Nostoc sp.]